MGSSLYGTGIDLDFTKTLKEIDRERSIRDAEIVAQNLIDNYHHRQSWIKRQEEAEQLREKEITKAKALEQEAKALEEKENFGKVLIFLGVFPGDGARKVKHFLDITISQFRSLEKLSPDRKITVNGVPVDDSYILTEKDVKNGEITVFALG